ncbi:GroES-like protein [Dothidotthia symphoricarpi CBS 119687]|uniref:GroES-like protein n=1 Tax=Dothidotthia symphoricarpi CBS 119687 TaxID=1392245 RepID=A0A6A6AD91_9PLEO|nr:GroES-like protein [Dothidotthia symphoricarpi CBS 119687]KAF2129233.1 GroES-like protein [Dothidotthia symphoricarpi CBS 119687]
MTTTNRKIVISSFGDASQVSMVTAKISPPAPNEVQIKVLYAGMGGADIAMRVGVYPMQKKAPLTPGYSLIGRVHQNGANCSKYQAGSLVACLTVYDAQAELCNQPEKYLIPVPEGLDVQQAVAMVLDWSTAYGMAFRTAKISKGQRVFIHGLSGSVGYALLTFCKLQGAEVFGTASEHNHAAVRKAGATPFVYTNKNWMMAVNTIGGAHFVFDPLSFESWDESWNILAPEGGRLVGYGGNFDSLNGRKTRNPVLYIAKLLANNMNPFCPNKTNFFYISRDQVTFEPEVRACLDMLKTGEVTVPIRKVWALDEVPEAHRTWNKGTGVGAVVIRVADDDH